MGKKNTAEIRFSIPREEHEELRKYAAAESPGDRFGSVMRRLLRDGLRFRAYMGGALEKMMIIGVTGAVLEDDIQSLARCALEQIGND